MTLEIIIELNYFFLLRYYIVVDLLLYEIVYWSIVLEYHKQIYIRVQVCSSTLSNCTRNAV